MKITIGFSKSRHWYALGSKVIQLGANKPYSHCYIKYNHPITGLTLITQAAHGFMNQFSLGIFLADNQIVKEYDFNVTKEQYVAMLSYMHLNLGRKYGYSELIKIAIKKLFGVQVDRGDGDKTYICSEFAARVCEVLNILTIESRDYIEPAQLDDLLSKLTNIIKI